MKKSDYRKFQVKTVSGVDDFASMREIVHRRYAKFANGAQPTGKDKPYSRPSSSSTAALASSTPPPTPSTNSAFTLAGH